MTVQMIRENYGVTQIKLHAMTWGEFLKLMEELDAARYPES